MCKLNKNYSSLEIIEINNYYKEEFLYVKFVEELLRDYIEEDSYRRE